MKERREDFSLEKLVYLIESPQKDSNIDVESLKEELTKRNVNDDVLIPIIVNQNTIIAKEVLSNEGIATEKVEMHTSHLLPIDELREIYIDQMEVYMSYKDGFRFDVWSYAVGGI